MERKPFSFFFFFSSFFSPFAERRKSCFGFFSFFLFAGRKFEEKKNIYILGAGKDIYNFGWLLFFFYTWV